MDSAVGAKLWRARDKFLGPYRTLCKQPPLLLQGHTLLWANLLERASRGYVAHIQGAELLLKDLGALIAAAHEEAMGRNTPRPQTTQALEASGAEWSAAGAWAAGVCADPSLRIRFADWVPELQVLGDGMGKRDEIRAIEKEGAIVALARCCWPVQTTLWGYALVRLYEELVQPLAPFVAFADFLPTRGFRVSKGVVNSVVERWRAEVWRDQTFSFVEIRDALRRARERVRRSSGLTAR